MQAPVCPAQVVSDHGPLVYGRRPSYDDDLIGGLGFQGGRSEPAIRHVTNLGADGLFIEGRGAPAAAGFDVVSPPARLGPLRRLLGRFRRPR